jgi:hypothetical protein
MFATLAGGYPWPVDLPPDESLEAVLADQAGAGLALLSDGHVHPVGASPDALVAAWCRARDVATKVVPGLAVKLAVAGPWAAGPWAAGPWAAGPWTAGRPDGAFGADGSPAADADLGAAGSRNEDMAKFAARARDAAGSLNAALAALADAGCPLVEVHEPAASLPADDAGRAAFAAAHIALLAGVDERIHASLAITGGDAMALGAEALFAAPYRSHLFDLLDGPESWRLVAVTPGERGIVVGVGDASGCRRTRLEEVAWAASYAASTGGRGMDRVAVAPSGSLADLEPDLARSVLALLGEAVAALADGGEEVLARLGPRGIDARSGALGQYQPGRRRPPG